MTIRSIIIVLCLTGVVGCGGKPVPGVEVDGQRLAVVDVHLHTGTWEGSPPRFQERLSERVPNGFKWTLTILTDMWLSADHILGELDDAGVAAANDRRVTSYRYSNSPVHQITC